MVRSNLNDFIEQYDQKIFIRIHWSYSVNIKLAGDIFPTEVSVESIKIPVGKSYRDGLFKILRIED
jgi:DNA-binding LytR/AlgR family response regulator